MTLRTNFQSWMNERAPDVDRLGLVGAGVIANVIHAMFPGANVAIWESVFGRLMVLGYFGFFVFLWIYTHFHLERTKPVPARLTFDH